MIAGLSIKTVFSIINYAIPAIKTVEQMFRGRGRGEEKKKAVVEGVLSNLEEELQQAGQANPGAYGWLELILKKPELAKKIGDVVDSVVALINELTEEEGNGSV
jgi:hypothetical protein